LNDQIELPLEKGKKWQGKRFFEGCSPREVRVDYEVLGQEKSRDVMCWKTKALIADDTFRRGMPEDFDWEENLLLAPGIGIVKAKHQFRTLHLELTSFAMK
jgi:hypothetical protein